MIDSNEYKDQENKESDTALVPSELHILVTDADTNGYEISKMSDFMGLYAQQLTRSLADSPFVEVVSNIPVADLPKSIHRKAYTPRAVGNWNGRNL